MRGPRAAIWRFYAYRLSVSNGFYLPISVLYLQRVRGFGLGDIGLVMAAFSVAMVAAEIPTGYVGDRLGRRTSLLLGNVIVAGFMAGYTVVETVPAYVALHVLWAFGWAFRSGTADAWLYELLAGAGEADQFTRVRGRATSVELGFEAATAAAAGGLVLIGWGVPFLANAAVAVLGIPVLLTAPRSPSVDPSDGTPEGEAPPDDDPFTLGDAVAALRGLWGSPGVRWFLAYVLLFSVLYQVVRVFEQPALDAVGVSAASLGVVYAGFKLAAAGAASTAGWVGDRFGTRGTFSLLAPVWTVALLAVAVVPVAIVPVLFFNRSVKAIVRPIRNQFLNDRLDDVGRATALSGVSMVMMTAGGGAKLLAGRAAESFGLLDVLVGGGLVAALSGGLLWHVAVQGRSEDAAPEPRGAAGSD